MIDKIEPWNDVKPYSSISRVPRRNSLHIGRQARLPIERFASLDLVDHLSHIHLLLPPILLHPIKSTCEIARAIRTQPRRKSQVDSQLERSPTKKNMAPSPSTPVNRNTGAKPPFFTYDGATFSQASKMPGLARPRAAPAIQSIGRA